MAKETVLVAGLGLIGGSLAKSIRLNPSYEVIAFDINQKSLEFAEMNEIISKGYTDFTEAAKHADIIILAAPISKTIDLMEQLDTIEFTKQIIVSDTASVKGAIIKAAENLTNKNIAFIGGHPMAGSHKKGIEAAKAHLFENAIYVLTPSIRSDETVVEKIKDVLKLTKSRFVTLKPDEHDEMTGVISHFPHLIASSLVHQAKKWEYTHAYLPKLAAGGFRDITRIASSDPNMWQDIFYHNRDKLSTLLADWIEEMKDLKKVIDGNEKSKMIQYLENAKNYRDGIPEKAIGAIPAFYDLYVDIRDQAGSIASVAKLLADNEISIKNIEIVEVREGIMGALRLSFSKKQAQIAAETLLKENGYDTMIHK